MVNFTMWKKALTGIQRVNKEEFAKLDIVSKWLITTRASVFIITYLSAFISGILAYRDGLFDLQVFCLVTIGLTLAHATNNMLNDYVDWSKGVDQKDYFRIKYGSHPMLTMDKPEFFTYILATGLSALTIGLYLCYLRGEVVVYLTLLGAFFLLFYTWPLKYYGLGEISVFLVWGTLMVGGGYYTITQRWDWNVVFASCPYALGATFIIFGKHIDKLKADKEKGIYTLPVILGDKNARRLGIGMVVAQYLFVLYLVNIKFFSPILLITLASLINNKSFAIFSKEKPKERPKEFPETIWPLWYVAYAFRHNALFGSLFVAGMIADTFLFH